MEKYLKLYALLLLTTIFTLLSAIPAIAADSTTDPEGFSIISAPIVKHMMETEPSMVIHVLSELEFDMQHISGSINIPFIRLEDSDKLPKDLDTPLVFYCMGKR